MNKSSPITGTSKDSRKIFIWGSPLEFSLSPFFQEHASFLNSEEIIYSIFRGKLQDFRRILSDNASIGANITVPYKIKATELCDNLTGTAEKCDSVNTLFKEGTKIIGDNTDGQGLFLWLKRKGNLKSEKIGILGNGGTSRSLAHTFKNEGLDVTIFGRTEKGWEKNFGQFKNIEKWRNCTLTVNTLPFRKSGDNVVDISYRFGDISDDAAGMLACQGWLAFKRWFNTEITLEKFIDITFTHAQAQTNSIFIKYLKKLK